MSIDVGRASVYAAELAAFDGTSFESIVDLAELVRLGRSIQTAGWWPRRPVPIRAARATARSSTTRVGDDGPVVRLAAGQMTPATLVHELAHVLAGVAAGHGAHFRRAHLDLAGVAFGAEPAGWLADAYGSMGLDVGERSWTAPPVGRATARPIAL